MVLICLASFLYLISSRLSTNNPIDITNVLQDHQSALATRQTLRTAQRCLSQSRQPTLHLCLLTQPSNPVLAKDDGTLEGGWWYRPTKVVDCKKCIGCDNVRAKDEFEFEQWQNKRGS